jgi:hypothetical protein
MTVVAGVVTTRHADLWPRSVRLDVYQGIGPGADA